ncbi:uncharacterized protein MEPE_05043 [Melanopsichium pennsylvanicum]|uniref:BIR-domain-containing protein n=2 Tax=Melanopsichium pennsylvanicum TaxID=63383 RepID=A0AAJ4XNS1_9BASI|nr:conserved hypothetical protein [Melanopsichium pennsylvanicum 4]SNX86334.1 uncharacterized protein MEPE_05043 [Melanopsichium pennsylvanicum]
MFAEEERMASFSTTSTSTSAAKKRQFTKMTASSSSLSWPHPTTGRSVKSSGIPTPALLAKHGFYHAPTSEALDAVCHFLYPDVTITNWQSNDDPLARLEEAIPGNGWCRIFRSHDRGIVDKESGKWIWQDAELLPTSKEMMQARKETFGTQWPYDGKKGWKPTSKKLAEAGFFFTPNEEEPDNAKCIYCHKALGGWEKSDDPIHEHQRRHPECAFFNCELREPEDAAPVEEPVAEEAAPGVDTEEEVELIAAPKKGKRVASTTRKASNKVSKAKKSALLAAKEEEVGQETSEGQDGTPAPETEAPAEEDVTEEPAVEAVPAKKGGRKTRSVSQRKAAAQEAEVEEAAEEPVEEEASPAVEELAKTLSKKKSATGLGNGNTATAARPSRAASRRATKAIGLLSADGDVNRIPRRPDKEDIEERELALSDPTPFPSAKREDAAKPVTDSVQPAKPKRSRSKNKKLDQTETEEDPAPEPEPEPELVLETEPEAEDEAELMPEDNTIIEHEASEADVEEEREEPVEEPTRRGRGAKAVRSSSKASTAGTGSRIASTKAVAPPASKKREVETPKEASALAIDPIVFPSMSSEADPEPERQRRSSRHVSSGLAPVSNKNSKKASSRAGSSQPCSDHASSSTSTKRGPAKSRSLANEIEAASTDGDNVEMTDSDALLPNTGSQATIRATHSSSALPTSTLSSGNGRIPLSQLEQLSTLEVDESERAMTLGEWLQMKAQASALEMRVEGEAQLADLENELRLGRNIIETRLRGHVLS